MQIRIIAVTRAARTVENENRRFSAHRSSPIDYIILYYTILLYIIILLLYYSYSHYNVRIETKRTNENVSPTDRAVA